MDRESFFFQALIYLIAAVVSVPIAKKVGLGSVLGYLIAGIVIGPFILGFIGHEGEDLMHFAEFGVDMMLFLIGLELRPKVLWQMRRQILGLGGMQVLFSALVIAGIAYALLGSVSQAFVIGMVMALSSTAIVIQSLAEKGILRNKAGQSSFSVLLFQDISVIPMLALIPLFAPVSGHTDMEAHAGALDLTGWQQLILIIAIVTVVVLVAKFLARHIFRLIAGAQIREIFTATALLIVIAMAVLMKKVGLSAALGTFLAGVVLADNEYRHELESSIEPFKGLLLGLFFIAVGAGIDFHLLLNEPLMIISLLLALIVAKFVVLLILGRFFGLRYGQNTQFAFSLAQSGEFGFVLIAFSMKNAIFSDEVSNALLLIVALSMAATPLLLMINEKFMMSHYNRRGKVREEEEIQEEENPVILAGFGRFGMVLGRFLIANGFNITILDHNSDYIQVMRKFGFKVYYGDASRLDLLEAAGAKKAKLLVLAMDDKDKSLEIASLVKDNFPNLKIFARAMDTQHVFEFLSMGINRVQRDTFNSSLELGTKVLVELGFQNYQAYRAARLFKHHDEEIMEELYEHWLEDEHKYILQARYQAERLEDTLRSEHEEPIHDMDCAWDVTSIREEKKHNEEEQEKK